MSGTFRGAIRTPTGPNLSAYDAAILADGPSAYWPLNGNALDLSGNGNNGTINGTPTVTTWVNSEHALAFDGSTSQYVEIADAAQLSAATTGQFTVEAWIRPDVADFANAEGTGPWVWWAGKMGTHSESTQAEWACREYNFDSYRPNRISGYAFNNTPQTPGGFNYGAGSNFQDTITPGVWIYFVLVINSTDHSNSKYPTGWTAVYRDGGWRDQDSLSDYSVVPQRAGAPVRIGTATLDSFFQGAVAKVALYTYCLTATQIHSHYRLAIPAATGSISLRSHVGHTATPAGNKLNLTVGPSGVAAGSTITVVTSHAFSSSAPTCADSKGNVYTVAKTTANGSPSTPGSQTVRSTTFTAPINVALVQNDRIQVAMPSALSPAEITADEFGGVAFTSPVDKSNTGQGTGTTPGTNIATGTTSQADELVIASMAVSGPTTDTYTEDVLGEFTSLTRVGTNTGGTDLTLNTAYKSVLQVATYKYQPNLGTSRGWLEEIITLKAGDSTPTPPAQGTGTYVGRVGSNTATTAANTLAVTVAGDGVVAGHTVVVVTESSSVVGDPTCSDNRSGSNVYTRVRSAQDAGPTERLAIFVCTLAIPLQVGDVITANFGSSLATRVMLVDELASVASTVDAQNGAQGNTANPSVTSPATAHANDFLYAVLGVSDTASDALSDTDVIHQWTPLPTVGTTTVGGTGDKALFCAYRAVGATGSYVYAPTMAVAAPWVSFILALQAS